MPAAATEVERQGRTAVVRVRGDVAIPTARRLYGTLRALCRRRDVNKVRANYARRPKINRIGKAGIPGDHT